ncbi:MAG: hypothetical protein ACETWM_16720 [Candidatus Lokiarchaeia archaeon]
MRLKLLALFTYAVLLAASSITLMQNTLPTPITWDTMPSPGVAYGSKGGYNTNG